MSSIGSSVEEGANVFADSFADLNAEPTVGRYLKGLVFVVSCGVSGLIQSDRARTGYDFHPLRFCGVEMITAGINQTEGLLGTIAKGNGVTDDFSVKVNVSFGGDGDLVEINFLHKVN